MARSINKSLYDEFINTSTLKLTEPLGQIQNACNELLEMNGEIQMVQMIRGSTYENLNLINDIRDYAEMQLGKIVLENRPTDMNALFASVAEIAELMTQDNNDVEIQKDTVDDLPEMKSHDARIQQVLLNMIHNSTKFTERGFIRLSAIKGDDVVTFSIPPVI